jgi:Helicase HerA, central domain
MTDAERRALMALTFNLAPTREDVWQPQAVHVDGLNDKAEQRILRSFGETKGAVGCPLGVALLGQQGAGKTHLLQWARERVQREGGYFFVVGLLQGWDFWRNVAHALLDDLGRKNAGGDDQATVLLRRLALRAGTPASVSGEIIGSRPLTKAGLDRFVNDVRTVDRRVGRECQDTLRALVMLNAADQEVQDTGEAHLTSQGEAVEGQFVRWGIRSTDKPAQVIVSEISRLLALTGPTLLAIDQIDTLVSQMPAGGERSGEGRDALLEQIGHGVMGLRETLQRTLVVVACFYRVWQTLVEQASVGSVGDRFHEVRLPPLDSPGIAADLTAAWLDAKYRGAGFAPPHRTWPVLPEAFESVPKRFTPRGLLKRIRDHAEACLARDEVVELAEFDEEPDAAASAYPVAEPPDAAVLAALDERFEELRSRADTRDACGSATENERMPALLYAGLGAWLVENGHKTGFSLDTAYGKRPSFHARLRQSLSEETEDQIHWAFRSIAGPHHIAVGSRIEHFRTIVGLRPQNPKIKAYVLRTGRWSAGPRTREKIERYTSDGGLIVEVDAAELAVFDALRAMFGENGEHDEDLRAWLAYRQPASGTALFRAVFGEPEPRPVPVASPDGPGSGSGPGPGSGSGSGSGSGPDGGGGSAAAAGPSAPDERAESAADGAEKAADEPGDPSSPERLPIGRTVDLGEVVSLPLEALRKHTVIFAGSGSGKTVLIRRIVEECALRGVSSIVLDPNNDLARLGDGWPQPPSTWDAGDAARALDYLASTDVVVWTPRREAGRPLSLQPLPDFSAVLEDPDEFGLALDSAVATLAPRARITGTTAKAERGRAVLREALTYFACRGGSGLTGFTDLLAELPPEVTSLARADEIAADVAQTLKAAMINDPLFGGSGVPLDPEALLTPARGRRARISVISFVGLPSNEQRQSFVNQLEMALFAWIKQHPAGDRPLGGLFVMDEAQTLAPSGALTACTESTLALASQARKYGLGLIFATQSPRGIHNRIVGNAATQFYGFLNAPAQVAAAKEMAAAKASGVADISRLTAGQFYAVGEGLAFQKVSAPMCLSHHPASALSAEEVLARARAGA